MVHPFVAIQAFLLPVLRTAAEIYFRAAGGRASFLLVPATRQTPIAKIYLRLVLRRQRIFNVLMMQVNVCYFDQLILVLIPRLTFWIQTAQL